MVIRKQSIVLLFVAVLFTSNINASEYNFGYACQTNGHWTQSALQESQKLIEVLSALQNNENCNGLESIVANLMATESKFKNNISAAKLRKEDDKVDGIDEDNTDEQKKFLNTVVSNDPGSIKNSGGFFDLLAGVHMTSAVNKTLNFTSKLAGGVLGTKEQVINGLDQSAGELSNVVNQALTAFTGPKLDQCLVHAPDQGLVVIAGMLRLVANTSVPGVSGAANRIGQTMANFVKYMHQSSFGKSLRKLKQNELWASISCALESSADNYCSTRDQLKLLKWGLKSMDESGVYGGGSNKKDNFLTGYHTLLKNVPTIAQWLLKVQFGVEPKLITDATYKNSIWETVIGIITSINDLKAVFNEYQRNILKAHGNLKTQKNMIFGLLDQIKFTMSRAVSTGGGGGGSEINFYTNSLPMNFLALILVGMERVDYPKEILPTEDKVGVPMSAENWLQNGGDYRPMFDDPVKLLATIKHNMEGTIELVQTEMRKFFIDRLIVDKMNLVAEAFTTDSTSASVDDSIKIILRYLEGLKIRIEKSPYGDKQVVHLINDTLIQLSQVSVAIDDYGNLVGDEEKAQKAAEQVIETVYEEFNVLIQRDSFITNRMATLVHYDYFLQILENKNIGKYERDLMIISNNEAYQKLILSHGENPAAMKEDYQNAMMIHDKNIIELEKIFRGNFLNYLRTLTDDAKGRSVGVRNLMSINNILKDNVLWLPKSIFGHKYQYKIEVSNPFNPSYKRKGDNESGSYISNRNRACIQLLASPRPLKVYGKLCHDAKVSSPFVESVESEERKKELDHLSVYFGDYVNVRDYGNIYSPMGFRTLYKYRNFNSKKNNDEKICAYRDYLRRNHVHWLTLQHDQIKKHKIKSVEKKTKADDILTRARNRIRLKEMNQLKRNRGLLKEQVQKIEIELKEVTKKVKRNQRKIEGRRKKISFLMKSNYDQKEIMKRNDEMMDLEDLQYELEDTVEDKKYRAEVLEVKISEITVQVIQFERIISE